MTPLDVSTKKVRRELNDMEKEELELGVMVLHEVSMTQCLVAGLELEEAQ